MATGCQDGLLRIYDVCNPSAAPVELRVAANPAEGISKVAWSVAEPDLVFVGKKSGVLEKWDTRIGTTAPVASISIPGGETIMDFEQNAGHNVVMVASGKKVRRRLELSAYAAVGSAVAGFRWLGVRLNPDVLLSADAAVEVSSRPITVLCITA